MNPAKLMYRTKTAAVHIGHVRVHMTALEQTSVMEGMLITNNIILVSEIRFIQQGILQQYQKCKAAMLQQVHVQSCIHNVCVLI